jgi:hypothetical protein
MESEIMQPRLSRYHEQNTGFWFHELGIVTRSSVLCIENGQRSKVVPGPY